MGLRCRAQTAGHGHCWLVSKQAPQGLAPCTPELGGCLRLLARQQWQLCPVLRQSLPAHASQAIEASTFKVCSLTSIVQCTSRLWEFA